MKKCFPKGINRNVQVALFTMVSPIYVFAVVRLVLSSAGGSA